VRRLIALILAAGFVVPAAAHAQTPPTAATFPTVKRGDRGAAVKLVQRALTKIGYRTRADGVYGPATTRLVKRYERRYRLAVDGTVSRGQARGMLRRARMSTALVDSVVAPSAAAEPRSVVPGSATFPIQGAWKQGDGFADRGGAHQGVDLLASCGTPLVAAQAGKVVITGSHGSAGNYIVIRSADTGEDHVYMHLSGPAAASKGDPITAGQSLGAVGQTGNATTCHLHFEIWTAPGWHEGGSARDPAADLKAWGGTPAPQLSP
jgi:murein DD-endopeptidase MepM/ murein hydrolase activator NlpD